MPLLAEALSREFAERNSEAANAVSADAMRRLEQYHWPGNVRELRNAMERATILAEGDFSSPSTGRPGRAAPPPHRPRRPQVSIDPAPRSIRPNAS